MYRTSNDKFHTMLIIDLGSRNNNSEGYILLNVSTLIRILIDDLYF